MHKGRVLKNDLSWLNIQPGPDGVGIDGLEDGEMLPAELLLPLELGLVHVLDKEAVSEIR